MYVYTEKHIHNYLLSMYTFGLAVSARRAGVARGATDHGREGASLSSKQTEKPLGSVSGADMLVII